MKVLVVLCLVLGLAFAGDDLRKDFAKDLAKYAKEDGISLTAENPDALKARYVAYVAFVGAVDKNNADDSTGWTAEVNRFSVETDEEFNKNLGLNGSGVEMARRMARSVDRFTLTAEELTDLEKRTITKDYTSKLPAIKNQGGCGSCWTFGATAALEYQVNRDSTTVKALSEQQYLDCVYEGSRDGCNGGWPTACYTYTKSIGSHMASATTYTYTAKDSTCKYSQYANAISGFTVSGSTYLAKGDAALYTAVADSTKGVMSVAIYVTDGFSSFKSGVYSSTKCQTSLNHAVDVVGYGVESSVAFWRVRNSWGSTWGDAGHINMKRGTGGTNLNMCRIADYAHYPLVSGSSDDSDDGDDGDDSDDDEDEDEDATPTDGVCSKWDKKEKAKCKGMLGKLNMTEAAAKLACSKNTACACVACKGTKCGMRKKDKTKTHKKFTSYVCAD